MQTGGAQGSPSELCAQTEPTATCLPRKAAARVGMAVFHPSRCKRGKGDKSVSFPGDSVVRNPPAVQETQVRSWVGKIPWRRDRSPTLASLPGESLGQRGWRAAVHGVPEESGTTEHLTLSRFR